MPQNVEILMKSAKVMINMLKINGRKKRISDYYKSYYNENFFRDYRYIYDSPLEYNETLNASKHQKEKNAERKALNFMTRRKHLGHDGLLGGEITYYKELDEYKSGDIFKRFSDRLFFDWDVESDEVEDLKDEFKKAYLQYNGDELTSRIQELQGEFRELIFEKDLLLSPFNQAKNLCLYLEDKGLKPYLIFSGLKGFHMNVFFEEVQLKNLSQVSKLFAEIFHKKLNLPDLDYNVFDKKKAQRRLQRCQYVHHSKTDLMTIPIPEIYDYDEVLQLIQKDKHHPIEFDFHEYASKSDEFRASLIDNDNKFSKINERKQRDIENENKQKRRMMKKSGKKFKDYQSIDMLEIFQAYGGEIIKSDGEKVIVRCLFHSDRHPSAVIFRNSNYFHCSSCGKTLNYYGLISEMEGTDDHSRIMSKVNEFIK